MNDQNEIKEPEDISIYEEDVLILPQISDKIQWKDESKTEYKIISHIEDFDALEQEWKELASESNTHIFQTFEWNRIWWKHFGTNKKLHIIAVYKANVLTGIAPLFFDDVTLFGQKIYSCLRFLGSYVSQPAGEPLTGNISYSDYLDCLIKPGNEHEFYHLLLQHFNKLKTAFTEIILDEVSEESTIVLFMIPQMEKQTLGLSYKTEKASPCPVIELDSTWDKYLESLSVKDRYNARRYYKRSKNGNKKEFKIERPIHEADLPCVLTDLIQMHQQQWNNRGFAGTFSEKRMRKFFMEIATSFYNKEWLQINLAIPAEEDTKYVAIDVLMTYKNRIYLMHRGMDDAPFYRKLGPGNVLLYARLKEAIDDGVEIFDMLRGSEEFKLRMATKINQNQKIIIYPDYKTKKLLPRLTKKYITLKRHLRNEEMHVIIVFSGRSFLKGIRGYFQFMYKRIQQRLNN